MKLQELKNNFSIVGLSEIEYKEATTLLHSAKHLIHDEEFCTSFKEKFKLDVTTIVAFLDLPDKAASIPINIGNQIIKSHRNYRTGLTAYECFQAPHWDKFNRKEDIICLSVKSSLNSLYLALRSPYGVLIAKQGLDNKHLLKHF